MKIRYSSPPVEDDAFDSRFFIVDTKATILASTPANAKIGFATDTDEMYLYDTNDSEWKQSPIVFGKQESGGDMGAIPFSQDWGYGQTDLSNKIAHNFILSYFDSNAIVPLVPGAMRWNKDEGDYGKVQVYVNGEWKNLETFTNDEFQDLMAWSDFPSETGPNGNQFIHGDNTMDMGAIPSDHLITGGEILGL